MCGCDLLVFMVFFDEFWLWGYVGGSLLGFLLFRVANMLAFTMVFDKFWS